MAPLIIPLIVPVVPVQPASYLANLIVGRFHAQCVKRVIPEMRETRIERALAMRSNRRTALTGILVALVAITAFVAGMATSSAQALAQASTHSQTPAPHTQQVVNTYLQILDMGMSTSQCDFSGMATIYAPNARVTASGGPFAPSGPFGAGNSFGVQEFQGIQAVTGFYTKLCHLLYNNGAVSPGWSQDAGFLLSPTVLNSFEHLSIGGHVAGRCMHVFTVSGDRITSLDWSVYQ